MNQTILLTGHYGYIGMVMAQCLHEKGFQIVGFDSELFNDCILKSFDIPLRTISKDMRDLEVSDLEGIDAVIHLAGLSNDPLGDLAKDLTHHINTEASIRLATLAKDAGVTRFIFSSSCSLYGIAADGAPLKETGALNPITEYAKSKAAVEEYVFKLANDKFHPTFMRNATVFGDSPNLRWDLVVNNLVAWGYLTGKITILSDGSPWRPLVHVRDLCSAFIAVLQAPAEKIHNEAFNIGCNSNNFTVREIAEKVREVVPDTEVEILNTAEADQRTYKVDFSKFAAAFPEAVPQWPLSRGIEELYQVFKKSNFTREDLDAPNFFRVRWIKHLLEDRLTSDLRWKVHSSNTIGN